MEKRFLSTLLALCMVLTLLPGTAQAVEIVDSGYCGAGGSNLTWTLYSNGTLTISGSGKMADYWWMVIEMYPGNYPPWWSYGTQIKAVVVEPGVTSIGPYAFAGLNNLTSVSIAKGVIDIGEKAFMHCENLESIVIPDGVKTLGGWVFRHCTNLKHVIIPGSVVSTDYGNFDECPNLTSAGPIGRNYSIQFGWTSEIPEGAFHICRNLTSVRIPSGITQIGAYAFAYTNLKNVTIPSGVTQIGSCAFDGCENLAWITIPDSTTSIGVRAFQECSNLVYVSFPKTATITNQDGSNSGGFDIFYECSSLTNINIPYGTKSIHRQDFQGCISLKTLTIPTSVTSVEYWWWEDAPALTDIYYTGTEARWKKIEGLPYEGVVPQTVHFGQSAPEQPFEPDPEPDPEPEPDPDDTAQIVSLSPANGAVDVGYDLEGETPPTLEVTFDRAIASVGSTALTLYCADGEPVETSGLSFSGNTLRAAPEIQLDPGTVYYITMDAGAVRFTDGSANPAIERGAWEFTTDYFSTQAPVMFASASIPETLSWDEAWFVQSAQGYNHALGTMSAALSGAAYGPEAEKGRSNVNILAALNRLNFEHVQTFNYNYAHSENDNDVVAYTFAVKNIGMDGGGNPIYLLAIVVKGTSENEEWYSNFKIGTGTTHTGFRLAAADLQKNLTAYRIGLKQYGIDLTGTNSRYLVTGHSRGAAVANLVAAQLTDSVWANGSGVFGYTFAAPTVSMNAATSGYQNIFNIVNGEDFISRVPLGSWGFKHYGIDLSLPSRSYYGAGYDLVYDRMRTKYIRLRGKAHVSYNGTQAVDQVLRATYALAPTTLDFYQTEHDGQTPAEYFNKIAKNRATGNFDLSILGEFTGPFGPITQFFGANAVFPPRITYGHDIAAYYSWLNTCTADELFGVLNERSSAAYKRAKAACPVDVYVYDQSGTVVASVVGEVVTQDTLAVSVEDGVKTIDLPSDQDYSIEIRAREEGAVSYTVEELALDGQESVVLRTVAFNDIDITDGDVLVGKIDESAYTAAKNYALTKNGDTVIEADSDSSNTSSVCVITLNPNGGTVPVTTVTTDIDGKASDLPTPSRTDYTFEGWYTALDGGEKVTTDTVFTANTTVYAQWTPNSGSGSSSDNSTGISSSGGNPSGGSPSYSTPTTYTITVPTATGGTVKVSPSSAKQGDTVTITVTPDEGYELGTLTVTDGKGTNVRLTNKGDGKYTFTMPNGKVTVNAVFDKTWSNPFTDVAQDAWYYDAVKFANKNGLMNGVGNGLFAPDTHLSRAQLAQILYNKEERPIVTTASSFSDVGTAWYANAVTWAATKKIVGGYGNGLFGPEDNITREQFAVILYRYAGSPVPPNLLLDFTDAYKVSDWAQDAIRWAVDQGILNGKGNGILDPTGKVTRAESAQMLKNYLEK